MGGYVTCLKLLKQENSVRKWNPFTNEEEKITTKATNVQNNG